MTTKKNPSNLDIYKLLGEHGEQIQQILTQVKDTNGRVGRLESWKAKLDNIAEYKRENPGSSSDRGEGWSSREKTLTAIITALIAIIAALVGSGKLP